jgi:serine/threonine protein phosphatase PrpC
MRTEEEFLEISRGQNEFSGSCVNCVIAFRDKLYCANLGDSRALLIRVDQWKPSRVKAIAISRDHKAVLEKTRIEKAGGYVDGNRVNGVLAICRSVGDRELKDEQFLKDPSAFRRMLQSSREEAAAAAAAGKPAPPAEQGKEDSEQRSDSPKDKKSKKDKTAPKAADGKEDSDTPKESTKPRKEKPSSPSTATDSSEDGREATPPRSKKRSGDADSAATTNGEPNQHAVDVDAARRALATSSPAPRRKKDRSASEKKPRVKVTTGTDASESDSKKERDGSPSTSRRDKDGKRREKPEPKEDDEEEIEVEVEDEFNSEEEDADSTPTAGAEASASDDKSKDPSAEPTSAAGLAAQQPASATPSTIKRSFSDRLSMRVKKLSSKLFTKSTKLPADQDPSLALRNPLVVVAAEPEIKVFSRTSEDNVVIIGSDGVYDVLSNKLVARTAGKMLRRYGVDSLDMVAQELVDEAHFQGSSDDITVVVLVLHPTTAPNGATPSN